MVPGFAVDAARIHAVVAVISARRLGAGIGDGYRAAGTGQHQRTGDRKRRQTTSDQAIAPHHIGALRFKRPQAIPRAIWNETSPSYTQLRCSTPPFLVKQPSFGHNVAMGLGRTRRRQHSGKDHHSDRKLELVGHPVPGVRRRRMAILIDSPGRLGPLLAPLCWRSVQVLPQQEFDQEGPIADQRWVHPPDNDPRGTCADCPHRPSLLRMPGKGQDRRTQSQGSMW